MIQSGRVSVNDRVVTELGSKMDPDRDRVAVDGHPVVADRALIYIALNKPKGYVTTCSQRGEKIVLDLVAIEARIYPVGRLDKESTGLILLTNDGSLHHRLLHPSYDHEKEYEVTLSKPITDGALATMAHGMVIQGQKTRPAVVKRLSPNRFRIQLKEGKNRQIRRMVRKLGNRAVRLKRIRFANIRLGNLAPGEWRHLSRNEIHDLIQGIGHETAGKRSQPST